MKIRLKILLILFFTSFVLVLLFYLFLNLLLVSRFENFESVDLNTDAQRVVRYVGLRLESLDKTLQDWAYWDETYEYMETKDSDYLTSNYVDKTFDLIAINSVAIANTDGEIVFTKSFDYDINRAVNTPDGLVEYFESAVALGNMDYKFGNIVDFGSQSALIVIRPILSSESEGPSRGLMMMARIFDNSFIQRLELNTLLNFELSTNTTTSDNPTKVETLGIDANYFFEKTSTEIKSTVNFQDYLGKDVFALNYSYDRPEVTTVSQIILILIVVTTLIIVFGLIVLYYMVDKVIISRLVAFDKSLIAAKDTNKLTYSDTQGDEITSLVENAKQFIEKVNLKLTAVSSEKTQVEIESKELKELSDLMIGRELKMQELKQKVAELENKLKEKDTPQ